MRRTFEFQFAFLVRACYLSIPFECIEQNTSAPNLSIIEGPVSITVLQQLKLNYFIIDRLRFFKESHAISFVVYIAPFALELFDYYLQISFGYGIIAHSKLGAGTQEIHACC